MITHLSSPEDSSPCPSDTRLSFGARCSTWSRPAAGVAQVAADLDISNQAIYTWRRQELGVPTYVTEFDCTMHESVADADFKMLYEEYRRLAKIFGVPAVGRNWQPNSGPWWTRRWAPSRSRTPR